MTVNSFWREEIISYLERGFILHAIGQDLHVYSSRGKLLVIHRNVFNVDEGE